MSLTLSNFPAENIHNTPVATVQTSLTESASVQNLRVRATIYIGGKSGAQAVLEQPDGINTWDFYDVLKSFTGKCSVGPFGGTTFNQPGMSGELLTSWSNYSGSFFTFSTSGRSISNWGSFSSALAYSNDLGSCDEGDIYVVCTENGFNDTGGGYAYMTLGNGIASTVYSEIQHMGLLAGEMKNNHVFFLMAHGTSTNPRLQFVVDASSGGTGFTTFCRKISSNHNDPGVYYHIKFEEVYENSSDVTTILDTEWSDVGLFFPVVVRSGEQFSDFMLTTGAEKLASRMEDSFFKNGINMEMRLLALSTSAYIRSTVIIDTGSLIKNNLPNMGWGMFTLADNGSMPTLDDQDETIACKIDSIINGGGTIYTGTYTVVPTERRCFPNMKAVSFVGDLGEETFLFRGLHTETGLAEKTFYKNQNRLRKVLSAFKRTRWKLRTQVETWGARKLLHEMTYTEKDVWMYDPDSLITGYREAVVVDDDVVLRSKNDLIESSIDIEYYE